jgi:hypothetical protein
MPALLPDRVGFTSFFYFFFFLLNSFPVNPLAVCNVLRASGMMEGVGCVHSNSMTIVR